MLGRKDPAIMLYVLILEGIEMKRVMFYSILVLTLTCSSLAADEKLNERAMTLDVGDSRDAVKSKWGDPADRDIFLVKGQWRDVWIYSCEYLTPCPNDCDRYYYLPCYFLFFENGKLQSWQDVR